MINRTLVRTKIVQNLFAFYKEGDSIPLSARKSLLRSFSDTYSLYFQMLDFANELTRYAERQIEEAESRAKATHKEYVPSRRFVENRWAQQVFENRALRKYVAEQNLNWDAGQSAVQSIYKKLLDSDFYKEYMYQRECTYEDDKRVWKKIYTLLLPGEEALYDALEEMELALDMQNWTVDVDLVLSYVIKSLKHFREDSTPEEPLLEMFDKEEELDFALELQHQAIEHHDEYQAMIVNKLKNWDADRVAFMDFIILETALTEILNFPNIAVEVSMNEYIEIAKEYSGDKSHHFVNGILNEILQEEKRKGTNMKLITLK